jgi:hypothetical protein
MQPTIGPQTTRQSLTFKMIRPRPLIDAKWCRKAAQLAMAEISHTDMSLAAKAEVSPTTTE